MSSGDRKQAPKTILVVDDSRTDRSRARLLLEKEADWNVLTAEDAQAALMLIAEQLPSLVVTDVEMPGMSGLELLSEIQQHYNSVPVVVMTAVGSESVAVESLKQGAASYVPKSMLAAELSSTVQRLLHRAIQDRGRLRLLQHLSRVEYQIENDLQLVAALTNDLHQLIQARGVFCENTCLKISNAIDEALLNAYYHGNLEVSSELREGDASRFHQLADERREIAPYRDRRIHVQISMTAEHLCVEIRDEGPGFRPDDVPDPTDDRFLERAHGRGIMLMRMFMDQVEFNEIGNQVVLTKKISPPPQGDSANGL